MFFILKSGTQFPYIIVHYPSFTSIGWQQSLDEAVKAFTFDTMHNFGREEFSNKSLEDFTDYVTSTSSPYKLLGIVDDLSNIREQHPELFI